MAACALDPVLIDGQWREIDTGQDLDRARQLVESAAGMAMKRIAAILLDPDARGSSVPGRATSRPTTSAARRSRTCSACSAPRT